MDDQAGMCELNCVKHLTEQLQPRFDVEPVFIAVLDDGQAIDILHGQIRQAIFRDAGVIQARDVRMFEPRQDVALARKAKCQVAAQPID